MLCLCYGVRVGTWNIGSPDVKGEVFVELGKIFDVVFTRGEMERTEF